MSDQCMPCTLRGRIELCIKESCFHHENWINLHRIERIKALEGVVTALLEYIDAIPEEVAAAFPVMPGISREYIDTLLRVPTAEKENSEPEIRGQHIKSTHWHDAGAYGLCSYCGRYSDVSQILSHLVACECGEKHGWTGSFKAPTKDSAWSDPRERELKDA